MNSPAALGTLLPAATLVAAAFYLAAAVSSTGTGAAVSRPAGLETAPSEIAACERNGMRSHAACVGEAEGKALIRRAEWTAALEASRRDNLEADAQATDPGVIVIRPPRALRRQ